MAVLKCKMCGGDLNIVEGETVAVCEYCDTKQTVPTVDNEKKMTLFARANRLRAACEFDKAAGIYENIVSEFPEEAEAYWGLLLCKYGIEYVDDPATGRKIPTCHRSSFDSIMDDENFEQVMENSDPVARKVYREEAKTIEDIRKGILEVSSKEEPYDIFICYKETDENGERTIDSVLAQDIYDMLTENGYRVFFSRITLEDKLGTAYEPYIFAALNSAKIMLTVGTDYDYYNAVWVKNEWSRFLSLIAKGEKKTLIPCYKDIDAYDIPKEFKHLQAQDMGKVGAMQDLLRGIKKIMPNSKDVDTEIKNTAVTQSSNPTVDSLLERAFMFLKDEDWIKADEYCEKVLDIEPKSTKAYLCKFLAQREIPELSKLKYQVSSYFTTDNNFEKIISCAEENGESEILKTLEEAIQYIDSGIETEKSVEEYDKWYEQHKEKYESEYNKIVEETNIKVTAQIESEKYKKESKVNELQNNYENLKVQIKEYEKALQELGIFAFQKKNELKNSIEFNKNELDKIQNEILKLNSYYKTVVEKIQNEHTDNIEKAKNKILCFERTYPKVGTGITSHENLRIKMIIFKYMTKKGIYSNNPINEKELSNKLAVNTDISPQRISALLTQMKNSRILNSTFDQEGERWLCLCDSLDI